MQLDKLKNLKEKIEFLKAEKAKCEGQQLQLDKQKTELIAKFNEFGVTKDTLPIMIQKLEDDITEAEKEIDTILQGIYGQNYRNR